MVYLQLLLVKKGSGLSKFSSAIKDYVISNVDAEKPIYYFNCKYFDKDPEIITKRLFKNDGDGRSVIQKAENGILILNHVDLLSYNAKAWLIHDLEHDLFIN